jgi:hypothetical protein
MRAHTLEMGFGIHYMKYDTWDLRYEGEHIRNGILVILYEIRHMEFDI